MTGIRIIRGNIFTSSCQTLVNTVNCVGVMGAGIAFEFKLRYPDMFRKYRSICAARTLDIGKLWLYRDGSPWVLNFPTKTHWRLPSRESHLKAGLEKFLATYRGCGIESIAFPLLGASKGGIDPETSLGIMTAYLADCGIPVEIYRHDPGAEDDLYRRFSANLLGIDAGTLKSAAGIRGDKLDLLIAAVRSGKYRQMNQLIAVPGIGESTLEKAYRLVDQPPAHQPGFGF